MPEIDGDAGTSSPLFPDRKRGVWGQSDDGYGVAGTANSGNGVQAGSISGFGAVGTSDSNVGVFGISKGNTGVQGRSDLAGHNEVKDFRRGGVGVHGLNMLAVGTGVLGEAGDSGCGVQGSCDNGVAVNAVSVSGTAVNAVSVSGTAVNASSESRVAISGSSTNDSGIEGHSRSPAAAGVKGVSDGDGNGVIAQSTNVGVFAENTNQNGPRAWLASRSVAGDFHGDVNITGRLSKPGGGFEIDHPSPQHTATKYLHHSFVESPDMKNVYDGKVVIDANGEATIDLPEYFELLNRDFRYQLTPIGGAGLKAPLIPVGR